MKATSTPNSLTGKIKQGLKALMGGSNKSKPPKAEQPTQDEKSKNNRPAATPALDELAEFGL